MTVLRVSQFGGMIPKRSDDELPENCAVDSINYDLTPRGLVPLMDVSVWKTSAVSSSGADATASMYQAQTSAFMLRGPGGSWAEFTPAGGSRVIAVSDILRVGVFLPADETIVAGQGCVDLRFSDGTFLGNVLDDQGIGSRDGDLSPEANGVWYLRGIDLASVVGKTISAIRFLMNYTGDEHTAYFSYAYITGSGGTYSSVVNVIVDMDEAVEPSALSTTTPPYTTKQTVVSSDEQVFTSAYGSSSGSNVTNGQDNFFVVPAQFSGPPRTKLVVVRPNSSIKQETVTGISNYAIPGFGVNTQVSGWGLYNDIFSWFSGRLMMVFGVTGTYSVGWIAVKAPSAAPSLAVVGGTGPSVTRSYVYTHVSEDGLESAPSPAVTATGNRDGTWQITSIGTWAGTDPYNTARNAPVKRVYRTPENSATYKFVAEIAAATTSVNDTALDAVLGETLSTSSYLEVPRLTGISQFTKGMLCGVVEETTIAFCEPYKYHAWPLAYRYSIPYIAVAVHPVGDRVVALTANKPVIFSGTSPSALQWTELDQGEPCIAAGASFAAAPGVIYPGITSWGLVNYSGYQPVTKDFIDEHEYSQIVTKNTVAMFDGRKLWWITKGATTGYSFEFGANERSLTKFEVTDPIWAMHYSPFSGTKWLSYYSSVSARIGFEKLAAHPTQRLKGTWKSKLHKTAKPVAFKVAQVRSTEWDTLSADMKGREAAYKTGGGGSPYTITITGLTQAEPWCYLKVWCEADKGASKVLVFDDFVVSDEPVRLARAMKSDCWQFEVRGNIHVGGVTLAELEKELNQE